MGLGSPVGPTTSTSARSTCERKARLTSGSNPKTENHTMSGERRYGKAAQFGFLQNPLSTQVSSKNTPPDLTLLHLLLYGINIFIRRRKRLR